MNSAIPSTCMDRYLSRYIVPPHPVQQHQQQLLNQQANQNVPPNGYYTHQLLHQQHQQQQQQQPPNHGPPHNFMVGCYNNASGWTGVPLISTASRRPRKFQPINQNAVGNHYQSSKADFDETAMSRLALHAHGAPLILTNNRYRSNKSNGNNKSNNNNNKVPSNHASRDDHPSHHPKLGGGGPNHFTVATHPNDSHLNSSQAINEDCGLNSGNNNSSTTTTSSSSDTCLPRIIKPRKRRKKDRKPNVQNNNNSNTAVATPTTVTAATMPPGHHVSNSLILDETTRDFLHEIALIANAGGTFDFGGIPLMHAAEQLLPQQQQQQSLSQHFSSNNSDSSDSGINSLACSCRLCDPFGKIWAFPLRRSCSDNSAEIELNRAKDVGVIGSNRSNSFRSEWRSSPHSLDQQQQTQQQQQQLLQQQQLQQHQQQLQQHRQHLQQEFGSGSSRKGSFSDSGDSGCDLLSGLTFCSEDILSSVNRELFLTPVDGGKEFKFPTSVVTSNGGGGGGGGIVGNGSVNSISGSGSPGSVNSVGVISDNSELLLISELTKKLNEGLDLGGRTSVVPEGVVGGGGSVFSDSSVFGDGGSSGHISGGTDGSPPATGGGPDLFVNFDAISRNNLFSANNISKLSNLLFDDGLTAPGLVINSAQGAHGLNNNVLGGNGNSSAGSGVNYIRNKNIQNLQPQQAPPPSSSSSSSSSLSSSLSSTAASCSTSSSASASSVSIGINSSANLRSSSNSSSSSLFSDHQQPFLFAPDPDRSSSEVLSCFDIVWNNDRKLLPVEE